MSRVHHVAVCSMEIPREAVTPADRMAQAAKLLKLAAERGAGWACLPELFATHYTAPTYREQHDLASEKEVLEFLCQQSKSLRLNLVTSLVSRRDEAIFNTAVLVSREGDVAGRYDKTHLPQEERCISAGDQLPVFKLDGVTVGIQLCYELSYPEPSRVLAAGGADILFWPHLWRNTTPQGEILARARAIENLLFICGASCASNDPAIFSSRQPAWGLTAVIGWDGRILAQTGLPPDVAVAVLDLDQPRSWQNFRHEMLVEHRRPELYSELTQPFAKGADIFL